jgi:hypothetical protein
MISEDAYVIDDFWHAILGHPAVSILTDTNVYEDGSVIPKSLRNFTCDTCHLSKPKYSILKPIVHKTTEIFELINSDLYSPFPDKLLAGSKYLLTLIDGFT